MNKKIIIFIVMFGMLGIISKCLVKEKSLSDSFDSLYEFSTYDDIEQMKFEELLEKTRHIQNITPYAHYGFEYH